MSRKIKLRFWDSVIKHMYYGAEVNESQNKFRRNWYSITEDGLIVGNVGPSGMDNYDLIPLEFIGVKDMNEKDIYEGDILEFTWDEDSCWGDEGTYRGYVQHSDGAFEVVYINRQEYTKCKDGCKHPNSKSDELQSFIRWTGGVNIEVIGNIYENPDLLKV